MLGGVAFDSAVWGALENIRARSTNPNQRTFSYTTKYINNETKVTEVI